jgi:hypothetical protein
MSFTWYPHGQVNTSFGAPFEDLLQSCLDWSPIKRPTAAQVAHATQAVSALSRRHRCTAVAGPGRSRHLCMAHSAGLLPELSAVAVSICERVCAWVHCVYPSDGGPRGPYLGTMQILSHPFFEPTLRNSKQTSIAHLERFLQFTGELATRLPPHTSHSLSPYPSLLRQLLI